MSSTRNLTHTRSGVSWLEAYIDDFGGTAVRSSIEAIELEHDVMIMMNPTGLIQRFSGGSDFSLWNVEFQQISQTAIFPDPLFDISINSNNPLMDELDISDIEFESLPVDDGEMRWVVANLNELREKFGGQWIAVHKNRVIAHDIELEIVAEQSYSQNLVAPFFKWIPPLDEPTIPFAK